jgi:predicted DNA-binding protein
METMILTIRVPQSIGAILEEKARNQGKDVAEYVEDLIEKDVDQTKTLDQILEPFRREVEESGISDDEFDELIEEVREEIYLEKLAKQREK